METENNKKLTADERDKLQEIAKKIEELGKYYPVEIVNFTMNLKKFRENECIELRNVESNIPLVIDTCAMSLNSLLIKTGAI